ncbi:hypothetical protein BRADI_2g28380v3 [Brachypodium distachyon]|uniref:RING-CH-type domain-containing protein n=1 Tax=Brachypodium distachyon TaxID=15368 RepID=I1HKC3_BRADI|nr:hypothetical protein BRADI_2g28380v3 [Brachypodium distachyon]
MSVVLEGGRNELMEQEDVLSSSSSGFCSLRQCRICHEEDDERCAAMESPCACSGSLKNFEPGYTVPPKKAPVVEMPITVNEDEEEEVLDEHQGIQYAASDGPMDGSDRADCSWCRSLTITFTIVLLVWHLIAVVTIEAAEHCAFSILTMYLLRAAGILLPFYAVMRLIRMIQNGRPQYRLQLLEEQTNVSNLHSMHNQEQERQLVINVH